MNQPSTGVNASFDQVNENVRNAVANKSPNELTSLANDGDKKAPLKIGKTYLGLFVSQIISRPTLGFPSHRLTVMSKRQSF